MTNEVVTTTYVAYLHPGTILSNESIEPVNAREPQRQADEAPDNAFAFFYFDIVTAIISVGGEPVATRSGRRNITKTHYINGELLTYDQVAALPGNHDILLSNMRSNEWSIVVRCRTGNFQPIEEGEYALVSTS